MKNLKTVLFTSLVLFILANTSVKAQNNSDKLSNKEDTKVTFYELGSLRCIPCKKMQTVIHSVEQKYGSQINVIFYDVWTPEGKEAAKQFTFDAIPTQILLDKNGKEFYRHEGFLAEAEIDKILAKKGLKFEN